MGSTQPTPLSQGEKDVLELMARLNVSVKDIKDAVQHLQTTDMKLVEQYLKEKQRGMNKEQ